MQERFAIRSALVVVILAALCMPTEQRPRCPSPVDCGENALGVGEQHFYAINPKYISRNEDLTAVKELMEKLLMQHNELTDGNVSIAEEESNSSENLPLDVVPSIEVEENSTERPPTSSTMSDALDEEDSTTERPPIQNSIANVSDVDQLKLTNESVHSSEPEHFTTTKKSNDEELFWKLTTVEPQQLLSQSVEPDEHPFEVTTIQPTNRIVELIHLDKSGEQVIPTSQAPVVSTQKQNISSYLINLPPTKASNRNKIKRTTTKRPQVVIHPQQLNKPNKIPATLPPPPPISENHEKGRPTTKPNQKISTLMPVDRDHDVKGEIQLGTLNRPISRRKPTATPVGSATSNRPKKKPINSIPQSVVVKKRPKPKPAAAGIDKPQGSPGIRNPIRNSVANAAPAREPEDYLISALASIADGGGGGDENPDGDEDDEDDEYEEENSNESEGEEDNEDEYLSESDEEIEERENFDSLDASDVISSVMKEVGALL